jgi:hypothetical protein
MRETQVRIRPDHALDVERAIQRMCRRPKVPKASAEIAMGTGALARMALLARGQHVATWPRPLVVKNSQARMTRNGPAH